MLDAARMAVFCLFPKHLIGTIFKSNGLVYLKEEVSNTQTVEWLLFPASGQTAH